MTGSGRETAPLSADEEAALRGGTGTMLVYGVPFRRIWATLDATREPAGRDVLREALERLIDRYEQIGTMTGHAAAWDLREALADPAPGGETGLTADDRAALRGDLAALDATMPVLRTSSTTTIEVPMLDRMYRALRADPPCPNCDVTHPWRDHSDPAIEGAPEDRAEGLDLLTMADVLTEAHLRREGFCGESHRAEAQFVIERYAARLTPDPSGITEPGSATRTPTEEERS